jgi:hypothetical protein
VAGTQGASMRWTMLRMLGSLCVWDTASALIAHWPLPRRIRRGTRPSLTPPAREKLCQRSGVTTTCAEVPSVSAGPAVFFGGWSMMYSGRDRRGVRCLIRRRSDPLGGKLRGGDGLTDQLRRRGRNSAIVATVRDEEFGEDAKALMLLSSTPVA